MPGALPKVSVLMPVFNGQRYLAAAIGSILHQTFSEFELIIINDGSADASGMIARAYGDSRVCVYDNDHRMGLPWCLNRGVELARGEYIARQDADDLCHPDRLRRQFEYLEQHRDVILLGTRVRWMDTDGRPLRLSSPVYSCAQIRWAYLFNVTGISGAAAMFRKREVSQYVGAYDLSFRYANDSELHSRIARQFLVANLPEPLYDVRVHGQQMTHTYGDAPQIESDRIALRNMIDVLVCGCGQRSADDWDADADDLVALRTLYTLSPDRLHRLASRRCRELLLELLRGFRQTYQLRGREWRDFKRWLSREWLVAANVHLAERPGFALWLWSRAIRLQWRQAGIAPSLRLWVKVSSYPAYKAVRARRQAVSVVRGSSELRGA